MADTEFSAVTATDVIQSTDSLAVVRSGVPYRFAGHLPAVDSAGNVGLSGSAVPYFSLLKTSVGTWYLGGDGTSSNDFTIRRNSNEFVRIDTAGAFSIVGSTLPRLGLTKSGVITWYLGNGTSGGSDTDFVISFNSTEAYRIDSSGHLLPGADNTRNLGSGSKRYGTVYAGTGSINTSDEREKRDVDAIPGAWLDAWGAVEWSRFRFKGGDRWHVGLIAQRVHAAFADEGLDAFDIGLCCFDAWEEVREPVLGTTGKPTTKTRVVQTAGDRWGLRYDECFAMEAAWQRRELARLKAALERRDS
jgi:hypothetical protein